MFLFMLTTGLISIPLKKEVINVAQQRFLSSCYEVLVRARSFGQDFKPMTELATVAKVSACFANYPYKK